MKHSKILALLLVVMMVFGCASALADYPEKAIEVLIPASPGGDTDTTVRAIAQSLTEDITGVLCRQIVYIAFHLWTVLSDHTVITIERLVEEG